MNEEIYSLSRLRDVAMPDIPAIWPLAPGAWVAIIVAAALLLFIFIRLRENYKRNAYRRAGIQVLSEAETVQDVSVVLKRVALAVYPREQVASIYGTEWARFLDNNCSRCRFIEFVDLDQSSAASRKLVKMAAQWIQHHRPPGTLVS